MRLAKAGSLGDSCNGKGLTGKARYEQIVIWDASRINFPNIPMREFTKPCLIGLTRENIFFTGQHTSPTQFLKSNPKSANPCKKIYEFERHATGYLILTL